MQGIALVIAAVNVVLRHLGALPDDPEVRELRETALGYINEVVLWTTTLPSVEERDTLMKKVLALHVSVNRREDEGRRDHTHRAELPGYPTAADQNRWVTEAPSTTGIDTPARGSSANLETEYGGV
jgi:hypothetical protein